MSDSCPFCKIPCNMDHCPYTKKEECEECSHKIESLEKEREYLLKTIRDFRKFISEHILLLSLHITPRTTAVCKLMAWTPPSLNGINVPDCNWSTTVEPGERSHHEHYTNGH